MSYYLAAVSDMIDPSVNRDSGGIDGVAWFKIDALDDLPIYHDVLNIITGAIPIINKISN